MGYYLYDHPNRHAPVRANGIRFWGYPQRQGGLAAVRVIVVHTAESSPDLVLPDAGAEGVAGYQSRTDRPSSYHRVWDSDSTVVNLPDAAVAFGARGANTVGLHGSFACRAAQWPDLPAWWVDGALGEAAITCRRWAEAYRIPVVRLTRADYLADKRGFVAHRDVDPDRRSDPGATFPWARLLDLVRHIDHQEDTMRRGDTSADVVRLQEQVNRVLTGRHDTGPLTYPCDGEYGPGTAKAVAAAKARVGWGGQRQPDRDGDTASPAFLDRLNHVVLYGNLADHAGAPHGAAGPSQAQLDERYAREGHDHDDIDLTVQGRVR